MSRLGTRRPAPLLTGGLSEPGIGFVTQNPVSARSPCAPLLFLYPQVKVAPESRGRRIRPRTSAAAKTQELVLPTNE